MKRQVIRREEDRLRSGDGVALHWRRWVPSEPRRVLLLVHGLAEHSGRYDAVGAWWASRDVLVHAYDHRGHGRSEGSLAHRDAVEQLTDDLAALVDRVRKDAGNLPVVLLGHSMGGLLTLRALASGTLPVDAAITSGAALEVGPLVSPMRIRAGRLLARIAPRLPLTMDFDSGALSRDPRVVSAYRDDPLVKRRLPLALAASLLGAIDEGVGFAERIRVPILLLHGESDTLCSSQGSRNFHRELRGSGHALQLYPNLRHEILNEPEREQVLQDALRWLEERGL